MLTKSLFTVAAACPARLHYAVRPEYANESVSDPFLEALAEGGHQVGALARAMRPGGIEVAEPDPSAAVRRTSELLASDRVTLFEAAVSHGDLLARLDILEKDGDRLDLVEVKAKSCEGGDPAQFTGRGAAMKAEWLPYLLDVAFQKLVLCRAFPNARVRAFLTLADKTTRTTGDGLNQRFRVVRDEAGRPRTHYVGDVSLESLGAPILTRIPVDHLVERIWSGEGGALLDGLPLAEAVDRLVASMAAGAKIETPVGAQCGDCPFRADPGDVAGGKRDGYRECWMAQRRLRDEDFAEPSVFDLWNYRGKADVIASGRYLMRDMGEADLSGKPGDGALSQRDRQAMQIASAKGGGKPFFDAESMRREMVGWRWPLHFVDFETCAMAVPFCRGQRPYDAVAFQFSHHLAEEDGTIRHAGQWLCRERGRFPNFAFVRTLKAELDKDEGTIFRYAAHENTILNAVRAQLLDAPDAEVPDRDELVAFIEDVTTSTDRADKEWTGPRAMVDLCDLAKRHWFSPRTGGSVSIKKVLPALLNESAFLQGRYGRPAYGTAEMPSLNYRGQVWAVHGPGGEWADPYGLLPPVFPGAPADMDRLVKDTKLADGGAAMTAYARMQFSDMSEQEEAEVAAALLRYCELDTLAMVMVWEAWREMCE